MGRVASRLPPIRKPLRSPLVNRLYSYVVGSTGPNGAVGRRFHIVYAGSERIVRTLDPEQAVDALELDLRMYVATRAQRRIFIHAGVVGWKGWALVLPGPSMSGKSRLVAALVQAGAQFFSDELAVLDARGRVHAYPAPLSLRENIVGLAAGRLPAETTAAIAPLPVGIVAVTRYREGADWRPRALSPGQGGLALFANTIPARRRPAAALGAIQRVVSQASIMGGARGEADTTAAAILQSLDRLDPPW